MNSKKTLVALAAAAAAAIGGVTLAQTTAMPETRPVEAITSTPGAGHTATCNTLRGGTGAHRPDPNACRHSEPVRAAVIEPLPQPLAAAPAEPVQEVAQAPEPVTQEMGAPPAPEPEAAPMRPARADRG